MVQKFRLTQNFLAKRSGRKTRLVLRICQRCLAGPWHGASTWHHSTRSFQQKPSAFWLTKSIQRNCPCVRYQYRSRKASFHKNNQGTDALHIFFSRTARLGWQWQWWSEVIQSRHIYACRFYPNHSPRFQEDPHVTLVDFHHCAVWIHCETVFINRTSSIRAWNTTAICIIHCLRLLLSPDLRVSTVFSPSIRGNHGQAFSHFCAPPSIYLSSSNETIHLVWAASVCMTTFVGAVVRPAVFIWQALHMRFPAGLTIWRSTKLVVEGGSQHHRLRECRHF